jgi:hypothetical protein
MATAANVVKLKRSAVAGRVPATTDLDLGELALNTYDGVVYLKKSVSAVETIVKLQPLPAGGSNGQTLTTDGSGNLSWSSSSSSSVSVGTNPPSSPSTGALWWDNVGGNLYINYDNTWVKSISDNAFPTATTSTLGGVKVDGTSITINDSGVISSNSSGITQEDAFVAAIIMG